MRGLRATVWACAWAMSVTACGDGGGDAGDDGPLQVDNDHPEVATLRDGKVQGDVADGAIRFLKIPFAAPPVGELRWKPPQAPTRWEGVRHETEFSEACPQAASRQGPESRNEDCLYLNVWRSEEATEAAPVMVWIHGGGNTTGSAADMVPTSGDQLWYDGKVFAARHGLVVVSINYRLGGLGFMALPELADEGSVPGNQGLLDQQQALRWVRDNIAAFGGDPDNVTIFGQSAGSADVCMHVVSPGSRGLFHRAVSESGGCVARSMDDEAIQAGLRQWVDDVGCGEADDVLACLRDKPVEELISLTETDRTMGVTSAVDYFRVVIDGEFLPESPAALFERGEVAQVPYILGSNSDEGKLYTLAIEVPTDDAGYVDMLRESYGDFAEQIAALYSSERFDGDYREALARVRGDQGLVCGTDAAARAAVDAGLQVYMYNYNIPWSISPDALGATHASEISHVFGTPYNADDDSAAVAEAMNAYWARFAATGDPNGEGAPAQWPRFDPSATDGDVRLQLDPDYDLLPEFRAEECALWRQYAQQ